jgi:hypothetical protein
MLLLLFIRNVFVVTAEAWLFKFAPVSLLAVSAKVWPEKNNNGVKAKVTSIVLLYISITPFLMNLLSAYLRLTP